MQPVLTLMVLALACWPGLSATAGVYKWVDENGRVHYGDRPGSTQAAPVDIEVNPGNTEAPTRDRAHQQRRLVDTLEEDRLQRRQQREQAEADKARRERRCNIARDRLRRYDSAGFLYDLDQAGERRVLTAAERSRHTARAQAEVSKWCR